MHFELLKLAKKTSNTVNKFEKIQALINSTRQSEIHPLRDLDQSTKSFYEQEMLIEKEMIVEKLNSQQGIQKNREMYKIHTKVHAGFVVDIAISKDSNILFMVRNIRLSECGIYLKKSKSLFLKDTQVFFLDFYY